MSGIDPKVDYAFKKLLGSESSADLLISFLNAVLSREYPGLDPRQHRRIEQVEILNPFQPQETDLDKYSVLDVKARDDQGKLYNIEMQMLNSSFLTSRLLYYWARLYEDQLDAGQEYDELCPAISVCICDFTLFPQTSRHAGRANESAGDICRSVATDVHRGTPSPLQRVAIHVDCSSRFASANAINLWK
ncbi:Rpn family recombination-promoting nuclease/putative transposase [Anatilimnocola floriformis]|uniref:Rpn family recombination-promoting nuclease/putative transposase n=1 Tax=Anatilimnocola floriformis TaxID=2948575 RepID=UPI0020C4C8D7|nr:Rpn family recombination-promoting nuclease/putative transposase [Anatilimnocola floriformis]